MPFPFENYLIHRILYSGRFNISLPLKVAEGSDLFSGARMLRIRWKWGIATVIPHFIHSIERCASKKLLSKLKVRI